MDAIQFEYLDFSGAGNTASPNLYKLFNTLNTWIKNNSTQCEKQVLESLLIGDLYSLLFAGVYDAGSGPVTPEDDSDGYMFYGYLAMDDVEDFKIMRDKTHDFSLLKAEEVLDGIAANKIRKERLVSKQTNINIDTKISCVFALIPVSSTKKVQKFDGISAFVPFQATSDEHGFESNGKDTITIEGVNYKIYGENSVIPGEVTIKIS